MVILQVSSLMLSEIEFIYRLNPICAELAHQLCVCLIHMHTHSLIHQIKRLEGTGSVSWTLSTCRHMGGCPVSNLLQSLVHSRMVIHPCLAIIICCCNIIIQKFLMEGGEGKVFEIKTTDRNSGGIRLIITFPQCS